MPKLEQLEKELNYSFVNKDILVCALTHTSIANSAVDKKKFPFGSYERLEFLGDRVLGLVMAQWLLSEFSDEAEGDIAKRHAALVCGEMLAQIAQNISLGQYIVMSEAEKKSGGQSKDTIQADSMEAVIGAVYCDGGLSVAEDLIKNLWNGRITQSCEVPIDYKSALQEWLQARALGLPQYKSVSREGPDHQPVFTVECSVGDDAVSSKGDSKKAAEKLAAEKLLSYLKQKEFGK